MADFRRNHNRSGNLFVNTAIRLFALAMIGAIALLFIYRIVNKETTKILISKEGFYEIPTAEDPDERFYLPVSNNDNIIHHSYYSLAYNEANETADWVAYELNRDQLKKPNVKREKFYSPDTRIRSGSAVHGDYINSGYTRGHLAPAGDMAFNEEAMHESFFMSNITPQKERFNGGIWRELEENIRDWAYKEGKLYIVTGPLYNSERAQYIGKNRVRIPDLFFKVVLDIQGKEQKSIGFLIENFGSEVDLKEYAVSVDSVERLSGIDFFPDLMIDEMEENLESRFNTDLWKFDPVKFKKRNSRWER